MNDPAIIDAFLRSHRIALVGASSRENDFSRTVLRELAARGYDVVPVNPGADRIEGRPAYRRVQDIPGSVDGVLVMTGPEAGKAVARDCAEARIARVWFHRGVGAGAVSDDAVAFCRDHGMSVVAGECPLMFLSHTAWPHRVHGAMRRALGRYPRRVPRAGTGRRVGVVLAHAIVGSLACSLAMAGLQAAMPMGAALAIHALVALIVFGAIAAAYFRRYGYTTPLATALVFAGVTLVLDAVVVGGLVLRSFAVGTSVIGTWLPVALVFAATLLAGALVPVRNESA